MMNARTVISNEVERLSPYSNEAKTEIRILYEFVTGQDPIVAMLNEADVSEEQYKAIKTAVDRLIASEPIQYVIGTWSFMGNDFKVTPDVLIPRADTEILCEHAIKYIENKGSGIKVLDLCSGSGCIGISIAKACAGCEVECADISDKAIEIIRKNISLNGVDGRVSAVLSDMLSNCGEYDVIVSNPPYIPTKDIDMLDNKVKCFEPHIALDGGDDGLDFYRIIAENADCHLRENGKLFLEIGYQQNDAVTTILRNKGYKDVLCVKDYGGNDRMISCGV